MTYITSPEDSRWIAFLKAVSDEGFETNPHCCCNNPGCELRQPVPFPDAKKNLKSWGFSERRIETTIAWFESLGIECDCGILLEFPTRPPPVKRPCHIKIVSSRPDA
jgi:hypothetical protein